MPRLWNRTFELLNRWTEPERWANYFSRYRNNAVRLSRNSNRIFLFLTFAYLFHFWGLGVKFVASTQPFVSNGQTPEQILEYTGAKNFATHGFVKDWFLVDYASSPNAEDHPFLYTHQPSAPAVLLGGLLKAGLSLLEARRVFLVFSFVGFIFFFLLVRKVTQSTGLAFLALLIYTMNYRGSIEPIDHFVHSFGGINFFGSIYFYLRSLERRSFLNIFGFIVCLSIGFLTNYITSIPCFVALMALHFLIFRNQIRSLLLARITVVTGVFWAAMLFGRNCLVLGTDVAFKDLIYTLGNRIVAWPTKDSMMAFFESHRIVLWGVGKMESRDLNNWLADAFKGPLTRFWVAILALSCLYWLFKFDWSRIQSKFKLILIVFVSTYAWHVIFFAQGAIYQFPPIQRMFEVGLIVALGYWITVAAEELGTYLTLRKYPSQETARIAIVTLGCVSLAFVGTLWGMFRTQSHEWRASRHAGFYMDELRTYDSLRTLPPGPIMTNIDALVVNFFTDNVVYGGCDEEAMRTLSVARCPSSFLSAKSKVGIRPRFLILSRNYVPGYQTCSGMCQLQLEEDLKELYPIRQAHLGSWVVYEIPEPKQKVPQNSASIIRSTRPQYE